MTAIQECINWNAARYDRVFNADLSIALLEEEMKELQEAKDLVDIADACGDIYFVCIGALWKLGFDEHHIEDFIVNQRITTSGDIILQKSLPSHRVEEFISLIYRALFTYVETALVEHNMVKCLHCIVDAICKSNNTKSIVGKTDPSVKANIDKGPNYVSPKEDLLKILASRGN